MRQAAAVAVLALAGWLSPAPALAFPQEKAAIPADLQGAWKLQVRRGEGTTEFTLVLKAEGAALAGAITGPDGRTFDIGNASFSAGELRFTVVTDEGAFQVEGKLAGGKLAGNYKAPDGAAGAWEGERTAEKNPFHSAADAQIGKRYYMGHCAFCHGPEGEGGRGVNLTTGRYRHGGSDRELFNTIQKGVRGTEMPGAELPESEVWRVVAFVRRLAEAGAEEKAAGNPGAGKAIYLAKGACAQCHVVDGKGGVLGPELAEVGLRRALKFLRQALTEPDAYVADNYRTVTVVTRAGERISGIRLNEDEYSIQLRDSGEKLRSFLKRNLKDWSREKRSLMPAYGAALTAAEIEDLVAYLSSLRGAPKVDPPKGNE